MLKRARWLFALLATGLMPHVTSLPTSIVLPLWPGTAPGSPTDGGPERLLERPADSVRGPIARLTDITHPTLQYFAADSTKATGAAVLVFPGGGYQYLAIDIEGTDICRWLTRSGIACVLVKYRVPQPRDSSRYEQPLQDAQRAIRLVRAHAAEWRLNPRQIGVIGFSAGGNVAAVMSNQFDRRSYARVDAIDSLSARPDFAMLVYPAYLTDDSTHSILRPEVRPSASTPPTFMIQAENDPVGVGNVLSYARALEKAGVRAELHVYPSGGHGYGMRAGVGRITAEWPRLALAWMRALGIHSMEMPEVIVSIDDTVGRVSPLLFGANHRWGFEGFGTWDSSSHAATPSFLDAIDTSGIATIRFPGGTIANLYHWKRAIGPAESRGRNPHGSARDGEPLDNEFGPDEYGRLIERLHGAGNIVVNFASGSADEAADWVEYMTAPRGSNPRGGTPWAARRAANGRSAPYDVPYWEVGNEMDLPGQRYWRAGASDEQAMRLYAFGGSVALVRELVAGSDDHRPGAAVSTGSASQRFFVRYPPVKPGSDTLFVGGRAWRRIANLANAGADDDVYTLDPSSGEITFGDGKHGAIPARGDTVTISYLSGPHDGFVDFYAAMKRANPKVKVCAGMAHLSGVGEFARVMGHDHPYDCVSLHPYVVPADVNDSLPLSVYRANLFARSAEKVRELRSARDSVAYYRGRGAGGAPEVVLTEYGHLGKSHPRDAELYHRSLDEGLLVANNLIDWIDNGVTLADRANLTDFTFAPTPHGSRAVGAADNALLSGPAPDIVPQATGLAVQLFSRLGGAAAVRTRVVRSTSIAEPDSAPVPAIRAVSAVDSAGNLIVLLVNQDQSRDTTVRVQLGGFAHRDSAMVRTLTGSSILAYNTPDSPHSVRVTGGMRAVGSGDLTLHLSAHSVTSVELAGATAPAAPRVTTFANPLDLDYRFMRTMPSRRAAADPVMVLFHGDYYLFATTSGGYWYSPDMRKWTLVVPRGLPIEDAAPSVLVIGDRMYFTAHKSKALFTTDDPRRGDWEKVADLGAYADPMLFQDDDGRVYLYSGSALFGGIRVVELDPARNFEVVAGPYELMSADHFDHGFERSGAFNIGAPGMAEGFRIGPYVEGSWMTRHDGVYYLQYSAPGTVWKTYADGVYTSRSPTGPFEYAPYSPFSYKPGGFVGGAGHASTFTDKEGHYWRVVTMVISVAHKFERRIGLLPAGFDADGVMRTNTYLGDFPRYLPGEVSDPLDDGLVGWMLLSGNRPASASSSIDEHAASLAFDEDIRTQWSARSGKPGEWLQVDLGARSEIDAVQINFGEMQTKALSRDSSVYEQYLVESSDDGRRWRTLIDRRHATDDHPHAYIQLERPDTARYVRLTNFHTAAGGLFAVRDLRVFGRGPEPAPAKVAGLQVQRSSTDGRDATLTWKPAARARRYIVRFGIEPDKLYSNYDVGSGTRLEIHSLNRGVPYYFTVDAVNERGITRGTTVVKAE